MESVLPSFPSSLSFPVAAGLSLWCSAPVWAQDAEEEVVVESQREAGSGASTVDIDETVPLTADVAEVLERVPGVNIRRSGGLGGFSGVSLRGSSFRQVQVYLDGVPLNPDGIAAVDLSELPLRSFEQVQVYRGFAPIPYGAASMGGVIDLQSPAKGSDPLQLYVGGGSFGTIRGGASIGGPLGKKDGAPEGLLFAEAWSTQGNYRYFDDQRTLFVRSDDRTELRENNQTTQVSAHGRLRGVVGGVQLVGQESFVWRQGGLPGPIGDPAYDASLGTWRSMTSLQARGTVGRTDLLGRIWGFGRQQSLDDRASEIGLGRQWQRDTTWALGGQGDVGVPFTSWLRGLMTLTGRAEQFQRQQLEQGEQEEAKTRGMGNAAASLDLWALPQQLRFSPVVDVRFVGGAGPVMVRALPRLEAFWSPAGPWTVQAHIGQYFRPPDLTELYGDQGAVVGNPDLLPERGWQTDLSVGFEQERRQWALAIRLDGFYGRSLDRIVYLTTSQRTVTPVNFGDSRIWGAELGLSAGWLPWVDGRVAATYTGSEVLTDDPAVQGKRLPFVPEWQLETVASAGWEQWVRVQYRFHFLSGNATDGANRSVQAPRPLHDLTVRVQPRENWPHVELTVANVADTRGQVVPTDPLQPAGGRRVQAVTDFLSYPLPGRSVQLMVSWTARPKE